MPDFPGLRGVRENQPGDFATTDQSVVPAEVVIQDEIENVRLLFAQRLPRAFAHLGFEAAATERADDAAIGEEERLGSALLRAGPFHAGDDSERKGFARLERNEDVGENVLHRTARSMARIGGGGAEIFGVTPAFQPAG
jgi:hypothetical protein